VPQPPDTDVAGFLPDEEGLQLYTWALNAAMLGPLLEIGSYCGRSTIWLAQAAREKRGVVFAVDHHRGSEEHQPGESHHDSALVDDSGNVDTLAMFRRNIRRAGLENEVIPVVGGHSLSAALADFRAWAPRVLPGGILAIHDVFPDPAEGGQAPFAIWRLALQSGLFERLEGTGSLRGFRRIAT
jgi:cephalosporin hydroxylase